MYSTALYNTCSVLYCSLKYCSLLYSVQSSSWLYPNVWDDTPVHTVLCGKLYHFTSLLYCTVFHCTSHHYSIEQSCKKLNIVSLKLFWIKIWQKNMWRVRLQSFLSVPWVITQTEQNDHPSTDMKKFLNSHIFRF